MVRFIVASIALVPCFVSAIHAQDKKDADTMAVKLLASPQTLADWHGTTRKQQAEWKQKQDFLTEKRLGDEQLIVLEAMKGKAIAWKTKVTAKYPDNLISVEDFWHAPRRPMGGGSDGIQVTFPRKSLSGADLSIGDPLILRGTIASYEFSTSKDRIRIVLKDDATLSRDVPPAKK